MKNGYQQAPDDESRSCLRPQILRGHDAPFARLVIYRTGHFATAHHLGHRSAIVDVPGSLEFLKDRTPLDRLRDLLAPERK